MEAAIRRRAEFEVGLEELDGINCVVPVYTYKTPPYNGIIEHEYCPIFVAFTREEPQPNPDEVEAFQWVTWTAYVRMLELKPEKMSYWSKDQYRILQNHEPFASLH